MKTVPSILVLILGVLFGVGVGEASPMPTSEDQCDNTTTGAAGAVGSDPCNFSPAKTDHYALDGHKTPTCPDTQVDCASCIIYDIDWDEGCVTHFTVTENSETSEPGEIPNAATRDFLSFHLEDSLHCGGMADEMTITFLDANGVAVGEADITVTCDICTSPL